MAKEIPFYYSKFYCYAKYLGYSSYQINNMYYRVTESNGSEEYRLNQRINPYHLVKFGTFGNENFVIYTQCFKNETAQQRFFDILVPIFSLNQKVKLDKRLLQDILKTNTFKANLDITTILQNQKVITFDNGF